MRMHGAVHVYILLHMRSVGKLWRKYSRAIARSVWLEASADGQGALYHCTTDHS